MDAAKGVGGGGGGGISGRSADRFAGAQLRHLGRAVQVESMNPTLKAPGSERLKLECHMLLSTSAFKFNLRRYSAGLVAGKLGVRGMG